MNKPIYRVKDCSAIPNFQSIEGSLVTTVDVCKEECRGFIWAFHEKVETTLVEIFPTLDALADAIFAGGYFVYYPVEITSDKMSQQFRLAYPDDDHQGESP